MKKKQAGMLLGLFILMAAFLTFPAFAASEKRQTAADPVKNNGGMYIKIGDDYWFRFYPVEANEQTALWGEYSSHPVPGYEKKMKCLKPDGTLTDAFTDTGYGRIWYINGKFYLTDRDKSTGAVTDHIYTVNPDGSGKKVLTSGTIEAYDAENQALIIKTRFAADGSYILLAWNLKSGTARELLPGTSGEMTFHTIENGKVLFDRTDWSASPDTCVLYCADLKTGKTVKIANIPASDELGGAVRVYETLFGKDGNTVYYSWGYVAGTGQIFQSGSVAKVSVNDPLNETYLSALPYSGLFSVNEENNTLVYETYVVEEYEMYYRATMDMTTGKTVTDPEEITESETHRPYEPYFDRWVTGALCMDREFLQKSVIVPEFIPDGGSNEEGIITDMANAEYVDGKIFCTVDTSLVNEEESVGWRTAYTLQHTELNVVDAETGERQALCQSTAGTPEEGEGGEYAETDQIGFLKNFEIDGDHGWFQFKPMLWIDGNDTETLKQYGIDPDSVANDYALVDAGEEWRKIEWTMYDAKFTVKYDENYKELAHPERKIGLTAFGDYMKKAPKIGDWVPDSAEERGILAEVTFSGSVPDRAIEIKEVYVP
jgi:hypothetical protein